MRCAWLMSWQCIDFRPVFLAPSANFVYFNRVMRLARRRSVLACRVGTIQAFPAAADDMSRGDAVAVGLLITLAPGPFALKLWSGRHILSPRSILHS